MEVIILLIIAGYALYGIYLLLINFGHIIFISFSLAWLLPRAIERFCNAHTKLADHKRNESQQQDLFARFSGKKRYLYALHPLHLIMFTASILAANEAMKHIREVADEQDWRYMIPRDYRFVEEPLFWLLFFVLIVAGYRISLNLFNALPFQIKLFPTYNALRLHTDAPQNPRVALEHAHAIRQCARHNIGSLYDVFVFLNSFIAKPHTAHYDTQRLIATLYYLEKYFPLSYDDEEFRRKYWNYARHIFVLLHYRNSYYTENSFFALPYPDTEKVKEQDTQNALKNEREKFQNTPLDVWSKLPDRITLEDALEVIGLTDIPSIKILHKLHLAVLEEHKDDPLKAKITAKAFEILGREAVQREMTAP